MASRQEVINEVVSQGRALGYSDTAIAGILGNIAGEAKNFSHTSHNTKGGNMGAYGLFQHRGTRLDALAKFAGTTINKSAGVKGTAKAIQEIPAAKQVAFMYKELATTHKAAGKAIQNAKDPKSAAKAFMEKFEVPSAKHQVSSLPTRAAAAEKFAASGFKTSGKAQTQMAAAATPTKGPGAVLQSFAPATTAPATSALSAIDKAMGKANPTGTFSAVEARSTAPDKATDRINSAFANALAFDQIAPSQQAAPAATPAPTTPSAATTAAADMASRPGTAGFQAAQVNAPSRSGGIHTAPNGPSGPSAAGSASSSLAALIDSIQGLTVYDQASRESISGRANITQPEAQIAQIQANHPAQAPYEPGRVTSLTPSPTASLARGIMDMFTAATTAAAAPVQAAAPANQVASAGSNMGGRVGPAPAGAAPAATQSKSIGQSIAEAIAPAVDMALNAASFSIGGPVRGESVATGGGIKSDNAGRGVYGSNNPGPSARSAQDVGMNMGVPSGTNNPGPSARSAEEASMAALAGFSVPSATMGPAQTQAAPAQMAEVAPAAPNGTSVGPANQSKDRYHSSDLAAFIDAVTDPTSYASGNMPGSAAATAAPAASMAATQAPAPSAPSSTGSQAVAPAQAPATPTSAFDKFANAAISVLSGGLLGDKANGGVRGYQKDGVFGSVAANNGKTYTGPVAFMDNLIGSMLGIQLDNNFDRFSSATGGVMGSQGFSAGSGGTGVTGTAGGYDRGGGHGFNSAEDGYGGRGS